MVDDDQEAAAKSSSSGQTKPTFDRLMLESAKNDQRSSDLKQETMKEKSPPCLALFSIMPLAHAGDSTDNKRIMVYRYEEKTSLCLPSKISNRDSQTTTTANAAAASYPGAEYGAKIREEMRRLTSKENEE